jgi:hypothetical protein
VFNEGGGLVSYDDALKELDLWNIL